MRAALQVHQIAGAHYRDQLNRMMYKGYIERGSQEGISV